MSSWLNFTCVIASHISDKQRIKYLNECLFNCSKFFDNIILSISCKKTLTENLVDMLTNHPNISVHHNKKQTQFQHINSIKDYIKTPLVIFMDDDDMFFNNVIDMVPLLYERYGQHAGVQNTYIEDEPILDDNGIPIIDVDFSGTFCSTTFLLQWLDENMEDIDVYDCDCGFVEDLSEKGRGIPNYYDDFGFDNDVDAYVYRREHDLERDWGK